MPRNLVSAGGAWTDTEKFQVMFSLMEAHGGKISWGSAYIPPGRSVKAVRHMIEGEKRKWGISNEQPEDSADGPSEPTIPKTPRSTKRAAKIGGDDDGSTGKKAATKRKRAVKEEGNDSDDHDGDAKKVKEEHGDADEMPVELEEVSA